MKNLLLLTIALASLNLHALSIVPDKIVTPFVDIFNSSNKKLSENKMEVRLSTYNASGAISKGRGKFEMSMAKYTQARKQASAVYRMIPSESLASSNDGMIYMGTAFHVGENLVLTTMFFLTTEPIQLSVVIFNCTTIKTKTSSLVKKFTTATRKKMYV